MHYKTVLLLSQINGVSKELRVRGGLIVGDSSLYFDDNVGMAPDLHDRIRSSTGKISFMQGSNSVTVFT